MASVNAFDYLPVRGCSAAGETYIVSVSRWRYRFDGSSHVVFVTGEVDEINFPLMVECRDFFTLYVLEGQKMPLCV